MDSKEIVSGLIDKIASGENTAAQDDFEAAISHKMDAAINAKKIELAQRIYSNSETKDNIEIEQDAEETTDEPTV